mgnify:FL=1
MKIKLIVVGKTDATYIQEGITAYLSRLKHYIKFELEVIPDIKSRKNKTEIQQKEEEGQQILKKLDAGDWLVLLDENGKAMSSVAFSEFIEQKMIQSVKTLVFVIGGPYGFSQEVYGRANQKLALSKMTFSHQMVRLFFVEQVYRAFTILKKEPYHHQ